MEFSSFVYSYSYSSMTSDATLINSDFGDQIGWFDQDVNGNCLLGNRPGDEFLGGLGGLGVDGGGHGGGGGGGHGGRLGGYDISPGGQFPIDMQNVATKRILYQNAPSPLLSHEQMMIEVDAAARLRETLRVSNESHMTNLLDLRNEMQSSQVSHVATNAAMQARIVALEGQNAALETDAVAHKEQLRVSQKARLAANGKHKYYKNRLKQMKKDVSARTRVPGENVTNAT